MRWLTRKLRADVAGAPSCQEHTLHVDQGEMEDVSTHCTVCDPMKVDISCEVIQH